MRLKTILVALVAVVVLAIGAGIVVLETTDFSKYQGVLVAKVKEATGRDLKIGGTFKVEIGLSPAVAVSDVAFANASWGSRPDMVRAQRFEAQIDLIPLLFGTVSVDRIVLIKPDILLETDAQGHGNWIFPPAGGQPAPTASAPAAPAPASASSGGVRLPEVKQLEIRDATVVYRDGQTRKTETLTLARALLKADSVTAPLKVDIDGTYNALHFQATGQMGSTAALGSPGTTFPVDLTIKLADAASLRLTGKANEPLAGKGYDLTATAEADEIAKAAALAGAKLPPLGPFKATVRATDAPAGKMTLPAVHITAGRKDLVLATIDGTVRDPLARKGFALDLAVDASDLAAVSRAANLSPPLEGPLALRGKIADAGTDKYAVSDLKLTAAGSDLGGTMTLALGGAQPEFNADLNSTLIDLAKLMPSAKSHGTAGGGAPSAGGGGAPSAGGGAPSTSRANNDGRVFSADPLPLDVLNKVDGDLRYRADAIRTPDGPTVRDLSLQAGLHKGTLSVQPFSGKFGGGTVTGQLSLSDAAGAATLKLSAKDVELGTIDKEVPGKDLVTGGKTDLDVDVRGTGKSVRALMAGLNGTALLSVGPGTFSSQYGDVIGITGLLDVIGKSLPQQDRTHLNCLVSRLDIDNGLANARVLMADTGRLNLDGSGTINLRSEEPAIFLNTNTKVTNLLSLMPPIRVSGTLANPVFLPDVAAAATGVVGGVVGGAIRAPGEVLGALTGKKEPPPENVCAIALAKATGKPVPAAQPAAGATQQKQPSTGDQIKDLGKGIERSFKNLFGK